MIIKDLWIISRAGLCRYHYRAVFSQYNIDETLFAGFIAALNTFTESLAKMKIEFLKMGEDEMYFTSLGDVIVVAITTISGVADKKVSDQLLQYIGKKFLLNYQNLLEKPNFQWDSIVDPFTKQIEFIWADRVVFEEAKRALISDVFDQVIRGQQTPEVLHSKITALFINSNPEEIEKTIDKARKLLAMVPQLARDPVKEARISESIQNAIMELGRSLPKTKRALIVLSEDKNLYEFFSQRALSFGMFCIPARTINDLKNIIKHWGNESTPCDSVYIGRSISVSDFMELCTLPTTRRAFVWVEQSSEEIENLKMSHSNIDTVKQTPDFAGLIDIIVKDQGGRLFQANPPSRSALDADAPVSRQV